MLASAGSAIRVPRVLSGLPRAVWVVLAADAMSAAGSGLTLPFLLVYLHGVRGIPLGWAGLGVSTVAFAGLAGNPLGGYLADRIGPRNALVSGLVVAALGAFALAGVGSAGAAFSACALVGTGAAMIWPSQDALLAELAGPAHRSQVFAVRHATMNAGLGLGAACAGLVANLGTPSGFAHLYVLDGLTFVVFIPVLALRRDLARTPAAPPPGDGDRAGPTGFRRVLADRTLLLVCGWMLVAVLAGAAQFHAAFPAYATRTGGLSPGALGVVYAANAVAVVAVQLPVLKLMNGRRRTTGMALVGLCWAAAWALTLLAGADRDATSRFGLFALALVVFAVGEAFLSPTVAPLVNDLAPADLRGRYNGMYALSFTTGFIAGPAACGFAFAAGADATFFAGCIALLAAVAGAARLLRTLIPARLDIGAPAPEPVEE